MNLRRLHICGPGGIRLGLMITAALSLWLAAPASAQVTATCNSVPATIVGMVPGPITGTAGNDVIVGTTGVDQISGLGGDDIICAGRGDDQVSGGDGDDTLVWNPGDGSDVFEGQAGSDTLLFNGSNANENIDLSANGSRLRFFRDVGAVTMDVGDTELVQYHAISGADTITVGNLTGTAVTTATLDLAGTLNSTTGDGQADSVIVNGTTGNDTVTIAGAAGSLVVSGLSAAVNISAAEGSLDSLQVNLLDGNDTITTQTPGSPSSGAKKVFLSLIRTGGGNNVAVTEPTIASSPLGSSPPHAERIVDSQYLGSNVITAAALPADVIKLALSGGPGNDTLNGSQGADQIAGGLGNDVANMGAGDDTFTWNPGDGSDVVEGQAGSDTLQVNGSNANENIDLSANGPRLRFFRDVANVTMDVDGVEQATFNALGGADMISVGDLSGTAVTTATLDLASTPGSGSGDIQADRVIINGTAGNDTVAITGGTGSLAVLGLPTSVNISALDGTLDSLALNSGGGDDTVSAQSLLAGVVSLTIDGGTGNDTITGSQAADVLLGGDGNDHVAGNRGDDVVFLGLDDDTSTWNPGDGSDVIEGQSGSDTLQVNGSNANENITLSANGLRLRFFRDVAAVTMDVDGIEQATYNAIGGADTITVNDLTGTAVQQVTLNLAGVLNGTTGDGQADTVIVNGTNGDNTVTISGGADSLAVAGLSASVNVSAAEGALDSLRVFALGGADVVSAATLPAGVVSLSLDGGAGNDTLTGSAGDDQFTGGPDADHFSGGPGTDIVTDFNAIQGDTQDTIP
jgi:Ca2+-binding RTX toxin-like protein